MPYNQQWGEFIGIYPEYGPELPDEVYDELEQYMKTLNENEFLPPDHPLLDKSRHKLQEDAC